MQNLRASRILERLIGARRRRRGDLIDAGYSTDGPEVGAIFVSVVHYYRNALD